MEYVQPTTDRWSGSWVCLHVEVQEQQLHQFIQGENAVAINLATFGIHNTSQCYNCKKLQCYRSLIHKSFYKGLQDTVEVEFLEDGTKKIKIKYYFLTQISHALKLSENNKEPATKRSRN